MLPRVKVGEMRQRVTIQAATTSDDVYGEPQETWSDVATVPAEVIAISGREAVVSQQVRDLVSWRVRMRHRPDVTAAHRLAFDGRTLGISWGGDPDGRRRELVFYCTEAVAPEAEES